ADVCSDHGPDLRGEDRVRAEDRLAVLDELGRALGILRVLDDPAVGAGLVALARVALHPLQGARPGADPLDRSYLVFESENRLDLQRGADPRARRADAAPAAQVVERVDREPDLESLADLLRAILRVGCGAAALGDGRGPQDHQPHPAAARSGVDDRD